MRPHTLSRRSFLAFSATLPWACLARAAKSIPVGLELYSVRDELKKDAEGTVRAVAQMGYQGVEFYAPYFEWSESQTKQMRKLLDDLGIRCFSTHNDSSYLGAESIGRARDMKLILSGKYVRREGAPEWKNILEAAENAGGVEYYLIEQEGSRFTELETARRCLQSFRLIHPA